MLNSKCKPYVFLLMRIVNPETFKTTNNNNLSKSSTGKTAKMPIV